MIVGIHNRRINFANDPAISPGRGTMSQASRGIAASQIGAVQLSLV